MTNKEVKQLQELAIWMTGCGYDFTQHEHFLKNRYLLFVQCALQNVSGSLPDKKLKAAGKLALSARQVTMSNAKSLSGWIEKMEHDLDAYDNEIMGQLTDGVVPT